MNTQLKIIEPADPAEIAKQLAALPQPVVFTNGCFDIIHRGHTTYLEQSRNLGASLVVALNNDDSVKRQNKGTERPINSLPDRMSILASLECVDLVLSFNEDTPLNLINLVMPDHLVKGGDWKIEDIVGAKEVIANGGQVHSLAFEYDRSTSSLVKKIREF